jgi:hypothetical protein
MAALDEFAQRLLAEQLGDRVIVPEVRTEMLIEIVGRTEKFINRRVIDAMPDMTLRHFNALLENDPTPQTVQDFVQYNVPNYERVVTSALIEFRQLYLGIES